MINYFKNLDWQKLAKITWLLIAINVIFSLAICLFKYFTFNYNALDLAIFNQVFYNTSLGQLFHFTIHPTSYLGDHFKPMILLVTPLYMLYKSPLFLLFWQSLFLGLAAIPLFYICKKHLSPLHSLLILILYLFNPVTLNIGLFEFHMLPMAAFFLFWTFYFYDQNKFRPFLLFAFLSLLIREDVPFAIFMFGALALLDRKKIKWILTPIISSTIYFFIALKIIAHFSASSGYKFLIYYQWLGENPWQIFINFFWKFPLVLQHVISVPNIELVMGFLLVFLFIPLFKPKYLLIALGQFLEIFLGFASGEIIMRTHYGTIFLVAFAIATIFSVENLAQNQKFLKFYEKNKEVIYAVIFVGILYNFLVLGPLIPFGKAIISTDYEEVKLKNQFANQIPANSSLVASYDFISNLSSRQRLYSLNYVFLGEQQYNAGPYIVPNDTQYLLVNFDDFVGYHLQYEDLAAKFYQQGDENMRKLLAEKNFHLKMVKKNLGLWERNYQGTEPLLYQTYSGEKPKIKNSQEINLGAEIKFLGYNKDGEVLSLFFQPLQKIEKNYLIKIDNEVYALGYGFYPTSAWEKNQIVQINFYGLNSPKKIEIISLKGGYEVNGIGSIQSIIDSKKTLGQFEII